MTWNGGSAASASDVLVMAPALFSTISTLSARQCARVQPRLAARASTTRGSPDRSRAGAASRWPLPDRPFRCPTRTGVWPIFKMSWPTARLDFLAAITFYCRSKKTSYQNLGSVIDQAVRDARDDKRSDFFD